MLCPSHQMGRAGIGEGVDGVLETLFVIGGSDDAVVFFEVGASVTSMGV